MEIESKRDLLDANQGNIRDQALIILASGQSSLLLQMGLSASDSLVAKSKRRTEATGSGQAASLCWRR